MKFCIFCSRADIPDSEYQAHIDSHSKRPTADLPQRPVVRSDPLPAPVVAEQPAQAVAEQVRVTATNGLAVPARDPYFILPNSVISFLERIEAMSHDAPQNVVILGPQGSGKTSLARQYAANYNKPLVEVQCGLLSEPSQWWGGSRFTPEKGYWYQESQLTKAIETPGTVITLDELNRVDNPKVLNSLFWLLDSRREAWLDDLERTLKVAPGVIFFATLNEGVIFSGIDFVDAALKDRFYHIRLSYPPADQEIKILTSKTGIHGGVAAVLVNFANKVRQNPEIEKPISTRQLLLACYDMIGGADLRQAVGFAISNTYDDATPILQTLQAVLPEEEARKVTDGNSAIW